MTDAELNILLRSRYIDALDYMDVVDRTRPIHSVNCRIGNLVLPKTGKEVTVSIHVEWK